MPNGGWMPPNARNVGGNWQNNMQYYPYAQNNYMNAPQQQQPVNNILRVMGPESAKAYPLGERSSVVLFDAENPIFYLKTTDDSGFSTTPRAFKFEEIEFPRIQQPLQEQSDTSNFVTKDDLENLKTDISDLKEMLQGLVN